MNKSFIKVLGFVFAITLASTYAMADDAEVKEVEIQSTKSTVMPVITMPVQKDTVEQKVLTPASDVKKEVVKAADEAVENIKTTVEEKAEEIKETAENANVDASVAKEEIKETSPAGSTSKTEVPAAFEALQNVNIEPAPAVNTQNIEADTKKAEDEAETSVSKPAAEEAKTAAENAKEETTANEELQKKGVKEVKEVKKAPARFDIKTLFESIRPEVKGGKKSPAAVDTSTETKTEEATNPDTSAVETEAE